ncbi:hypothetical protein HHL08_15005 [Sphingobium sp. AR-3-1]|uniref:Uncharacterized protein n=1 Tax=Sphingobium psychrophilum TaxID=2728834 RepID=A0A7X9ZUC3_9SPHN|nr:hypothetical protein [Sphingobium psychrophilum]NML11441.1 hypothetical protein [Sphingobium psychrophilum]
MSIFFAALLALGVSGEARANAQFSVMRTIGDKHTIAVDRRYLVAKVRAKTQIAKSLIFNISHDIERVFLELPHREWGEFNGFAYRDKIVRPEAAFALSVHRAGANIPTNLNKGRIASATVENLNRKLPVIGAMLHGPGSKVCVLYSNDRTLRGQVSLMGIESGLRAFGGFIGPASRFIRASLSMTRCLAGIPSGEASSGKCKGTYKSAQQAKPESAPSPVGRYFRSISSFPLGAKIGITGVLTSLASCIWLWPFIRLLNGSGNILQCFGAGVIGIALAAVSGLMFW